MIFAPDDFAGRPYVGGLNQAGHIVAGAAIASVAPLAVALALILAWEGWQFWKRGATKADFRIDAAYWLIGAVAWSYAVSTGNPVYAPVLPIAAFVLEYARINRGRDD